MRPIIIAAVAILLVASAFGIFWAAANDFGMRQAVEFFPYDNELELEDGATIRSSGVVVHVNEREAASTDRALAQLMVATQRLYPTECSGENWEIAVRRPGPDGGEEKYSFSLSIYEIGGPGSWIEYGRWTDNQYIVVTSYPATWPDIAAISQGTTSFHVESE